MTATLTLGHEYESDIIILEDYFFFKEMHFVAVRCVVWILAVGMSNMFISHREKPAIKDFFIHVLFYSSRIVIPLFLTQQKVVSLKIEIEQHIP